MADFLEQAFFGLLALAWVYTVRGYRYGAARLAGTGAMTIALLLIFSILTLWLPDRWPTSAFETGVCLLGIAWIIRRPAPARVRFVLLPVGIAALWPLAQLALGRTVYRWETWNSAAAWLVNLTLLFLALQIELDRALVLRLLLWFGCALAIAALLQLFTSPGKIFWLFPTTYRDFVMGPFLYKNQYAAFVELLLPVALVAALTDARRRALYTFLAAVLYVSVIAASSRAGLILCTLEVLAVPALAARRGLLSARGTLMFLAGVGASIAAFTAVVGWEAMWERLRQPDPYAVRREFFRSSLDMVRDRPWMGFGMGTWSTAYPGYAYFDDGSFANQAHNDWAQWAAEGGVPFALLMLGVAASSVRPALRSLWGIGVVAIFLHCLVDYPLQKPALAGMLMLFMGMSATQKMS